MAQKKTGSAPQSAGSIQPGQATTQKTYRRSIDGTEIEFPAGMTKEDIDKAMLRINQQADTRPKPQPKPTPPAAPGTDFDRPDFPTQEETFGAFSRGGFDVPEPPAPSAPVRFGPTPSPILPATRGPAPTPSPVPQAAAPTPGPAGSTLQAVPPGTAPMGPQPPPVVGPRPLGYGAAKFGPAGAITEQRGAQKLAEDKGFTAPEAVDLMMNRTNPAYPYAMGTARTVEAATRPSSLGILAGGAALSAIPGVGPMIPPIVGTLGVLDMSRRLKEAAGVEDEVERRTQEVQAVEEGVASLAPWLYGERIPFKFNYKEPRALLPGEVADAVTETGPRGPYGPRGLLPSAPEPAPPGVTAMRDVLRGGGPPEPTVRPVPTSPVFPQPKAPAPVPAPGPPPAPPRAPNVFPAPSVRPAPTSPVMPQIAPASPPGTKGPGGATPPAPPDRPTEEELARRDAVLKAAQEGRTIPGSERPSDFETIGDKEARIAAMSPEDRAAYYAEQDRIYEERTRAAEAAKQQPPPAKRKPADLTREELLATYDREQLKRMLRRGTISKKQLSFEDMKKIYGRRPATFDPQKSIAHAIRNAGGLSRETPQEYKDLFPPGIRNLLFTKDSTYGYDEIGLLLEERGWGKKESGEWWDYFGKLRPGELEKLTAKEINESDLFRQEREYAAQQTQDELDRRQAEIDRLNAELAGRGEPPPPPTEEPETTLPDEMKDTTFTAEEFTEDPEKYWFGDLTGFGEDQKIQYRYQVRIKKGVPEPEAREKARQEMIQRGLKEPDIERRFRIWDKEAQRENPLLREATKEQRIQVLTQYADRVEGGMQARDALDMARQELKALGMNDLDINSKLIEWGIIDIQGGATGKTPSDEFRKKRTQMRILKEILDIIDYGLTEKKSGRYQDLLRRYTALTGEEESTIGPKIDQLLMERGGPRPVQGPVEIPRSTEDIARMDTAGLEREYMRLMLNRVMRPSKKGLTREEQDDRNWIQRRMAAIEGRRAKQRYEKDIEAEKGKSVPDLKRMRARRGVYEKEAMKEFMELMGEQETLQSALRHRSLTDEEWARYQEIEDRLIELDEIAKPLMWDRIIGRLRRKEGKAAEVKPFTPREKETEPEEEVEPEEEEPEEEFEPEEEPPPLDSRTIRDRPKGPKEYRTKKPKPEGPQRSLFEEPKPPAQEPTEPIPETKEPENPLLKMVQDAADEFEASREKNKQDFINQILQAPETRVPKKGLIEGPSKKKKKGKGDQEPGLFEAKIEDKPKRPPGFNISPERPGTPSLDPADKLMQLETSIRRVMGKAEEARGAEDWKRFDAFNKEAEFLRSRRAAILKQPHENPELEFEKIKHNLRKIEREVKTLSDEIYQGSGTMPDSEYNRKRQKVRSLSAEHDSLREMGNDLMKQLRETYEFKPTMATGEDMPYFHGTSINRAISILENEGTLEGREEYWGGGVGPVGGGVVSPLVYKGLGHLRNAKLAFVTPHPGTAHSPYGIRSGFEAVSEVFGAGTHYQWRKKQGDPFVVLEGRIPEGTKIYHGLPRIKTTPKRGKEEPKRFPEVVVEGSIPDFVRKIYIDPVYALHPKGQKLIAMAHEQNIPVVGLTSPKSDPYSLGPEHTPAARKVSRVAEGKEPPTMTFERHRQGYREERGWKKAMGSAWEQGGEQPPPEPTAQSQESIHTRVESLKDETSEIMNRMKPGKLDPDPEDKAFLADIYDDLIDLEKDIGGAFYDVSYAPPEHQADYDEARKLRRQIGPFIGKRPQ